MYKLFSFKSLPFLKISAPLVVLLPLLIPSGVKAQETAPAGEGAEGAAAVQNIEVVSVPLGGQKLLQFEGAVSRVALGNPDIASLKVLTSRQLRLFGRKEGATDLNIAVAGLDRHFRVVVGTDLTGLRASLANAGLTGVRVENADKATLISGQVFSMQELTKVKELADAYLGENYQNTVAVADKRMIAVEVRFAAVSVNTMKALGINFRTLGNGFQFAGMTPGSVTDYSMNPGTGLDVTSGLPISQAFNLFLGWSSNTTLGVISTLSNANLAQVLAEPTLLVRSGEEADFLAGGEIPIPVPQGNNNGTVTIEYKPFGVKLKVHATVFDKNRIVMRVNPEVSELDAINGVNIQGFKIPAIKTRSTSTTVELGDGQSFVLAGLMYSTSGSIEDKVPGLGDLPVIGNFFKRSELMREQQELIIVATPRLVSPMEANQVPVLPGTGDQQYDPSYAKMLLNTEPLDRHVIKHGLMR